MVPGDFVGSAGVAIQADIAAVQSYAELLAESGKIDEAIVSLREAIQQDSQGAAPLYVPCANLLVKTGRADEALALLRDGIKGIPPPKSEEITRRLRQLLSQKRPLLFISYRISDSLDLIGRLDADLTREFGAGSVFRDTARLQGGQEWAQQLEDHAKSCPAMLVVIGPNWQTAASVDGDWNGVPRLLNPKDWVRREITSALDAGNIVIPIFLNDASVPLEGWLANCQLERLYSRQGEQLRSSDYGNDLVKLIAALRRHFPELPDPSPEATPAVKPRVPKPPELYAVPNYILTSTFIGRATELDELDAWAKSADPLMVVEGIGGLGKSALTWEWMQKRAAYAIPDLAGRVWWSFYERGASMALFVRYVLAYVTGQDPDALSKETSHYQRCQELLIEFKHRPFLLVLDGFERVLTAYQRWDKAQQRDDQIEADLRECADPRDGELLQQLLHASPSKVLLSTRLFPSILENRGSGRPIPGVSNFKLSALSRPDVLAFFRQAGIKGSEMAMVEFADQFERHSLLLRVVCSEIANYPRQPFDFDACAPTRTTAAN